MEKRVRREIGEVGNEGKRDPNRNNNILQGALASH